MVYTVNFDCTREFHSETEYAYSCRCTEPKAPRQLSLYTIESCLEPLSQKLKLEGGYLTGIRAMALIFLCYGCIMHHNSIFGHNRNVQIVPLYFTVEYERKEKIAPKIKEGFSVGLS